MKKVQSFKQTKINKFKKTKKLKIELPYDPGTSLLGKKKKKSGIGTTKLFIWGKKPLTLTSHHFKKLTENKFRPNK